jgi:hypothetical protein
MTPQILISLELNHCVSQEFKIKLSLEPLNPHKILEVE